MVKVALVTGAAGDIGAAISVRLARDGVRVVAADRDGEGAEKTAAVVRAAGGDAVAAEYDQTARPSVERLFAGLGRLDICVANAGYGRFGSVLEQDFEVWRRHVEVNLNGTFLVCQSAARKMVEGGAGGALVINASTAALRSCTLFSGYAASKAGAEMLARCLADELGPYGIRVNTVCPGVIETSMTDGLLGADGMRELVSAETPLARTGRPEEIANVVAFLAGDEAAYVTGAALLADGGQTLRGFPRWFVNEGAEWRLITERDTTKWPARNRTT
ncbi:SDR family NAD(P)-dependent oxidoreductase [Prauserella flavalba]|uniref:Uncharacterized protein n=1 Tax=Prauserella flavalba TaxID=1477506 RepID=A0A318LUK1_9PSEU|nr:SDR family NAD(P)-dependent oxidoreductase [Prauserella flavalba]PXY36974.1 hypothetical protein BA062_13915 [Prauserella flavalba]